MPQKGSCTSPVHPSVPWFAFSWPSVFTWFFTEYGNLNIFPQKGEKVQESTVSRIQRYKKTHKQGISLVKIMGRLRIKNTNESRKQKATAVKQDCF